MWICLYIIVDEKINECRLTAITRIQSVMEGEAGDHSIRYMYVFGYHQFGYRNQINYRMCKSYYRTLLIIDSDVRISSDERLSHMYVYIVAVVYLCSNLFMYIYIYIYMHRMIYDGSYADV